VSAEDEVEKLAEALQAGPFRAAFSHDPEGAMDGAGIDASLIPAEFIDTLKGLSLQELGVISRTTRELRDKGMHHESSLMRMPL